MKTYIKKVLIKEVDKILSNELEVFASALDIYTNPKKFTKWFVDRVAVEIEQEDLEDEETFDKIIRFISIRITAHYMGITERAVKNKYFKA